LRRAQGWTTPDQTLRPFHLSYFELLKWNSCNLKYNYFLFHGMYSCVWLIFIILFYFFFILFTVSMYSNYWEFLWKNTCRVFAIKLSMKTKNTNISWADCRSGFKWTQKYLKIFEIKWKISFQGHNTLSIIGYPSEIG
jgi:hypothetical protein